MPIHKIDVTYSNKKNEILENEFCLRKYATKKLVNNIFVN